MSEVLQDMSASEFLLLQAVYHRQLSLSNCKNRLRTRKNETMRSEYSRVRTLSRQSDIGSESFWGSCTRMRWQRERTTSGPRGSRFSIPNAYITTEILT